MKKFGFALIGVVALSMLFASFSSGSLANALNLQSVTQSNTTYRDSQGRVVTVINITRPANQTIINIQGGSSGQVIVPTPSATPENVLLGAYAWSSTIHENAWLPKYLVDGETGGHYGVSPKFFCTTNEGQNGFWMADMLGVRNIKQVKILGRTDYPIQSSNLKVYIGNSNILKENQACPGVHSAPAIVNCNLSGRYIGIGFDTIPPAANGHMCLAEVEAYEKELPEPENKLLYADAWQSTVHDATMIAKQAVDGSKQGMYAGVPKLATMSNQGLNNWWMGDMGKERDIKQVRIYGRTDAPSQSAQLKVYIGNSRNIRENPSCTGVFTAPVNVSCSLRGRYVGIAFDRVPDGSGAHLVLAEVEAYETPVPQEANVLKHAIHAWASGQLNNEYLARFAIDGTYNTNFGLWPRQFISNADGQNAFWAADFGQVRNIKQVKIIGRGDHPQQSQNLKVFIGDSANIRSNPSCTGVYHAPALINCALSGRYIGIAYDTVSAASGGWLSLTEVEAYESIQPEPLNKLLYADAWQSSVYESGRWVAKQAVDGSRDGRWGDVPILAVTNADHQNAFWAGDMGKSRNIKQVRIYGRTDIPAQAQNLKVFIGNSRNIRENQACTGVYNAPATINCELTGRYVGVAFDTVPPASGGHLSLAEVEAYEVAL